MECFEERNPEFFRQDPFWPVTEEEIVEVAKRYGFDCWEFGRSAGNRPIYAMASGEKEDLISKRQKGNTYAAFPF